MTVWDFYLSKNKNKTTASTLFYHVSHSEEDNTIWETEASRQRPTPWE